MLNRLFRQFQSGPPKSIPAAAIFLTRSMSSKRSKSKIYAVGVGRQTGLFDSWDQCKAQVDGVSGAKFKSFSSQEEAQEWLGQFADAPRASKRSISDLSSVDDDILLGLPLQHQSRMETSAPKRQKLQEPVGQSAPVVSVQGYRVAYTDGACPGNGQVGARAGVGAVLFDEAGNAILKLSEKLPDSSPQTNQRAEIYAAIRVLEEVDPTLPLLIKSDSNYVVQAMNSWSRTWQRKNWNVDVKNKDLMQYLVYLCGRRQGVTKWQHVLGHNGDPGNTLADQLAVEGASKASVAELKFKFPIPPDYL